MKKTLILCVHAMLASTVYGAIGTQTTGNLYSLGVIDGLGPVFRTVLAATSTSYTASNIALTCSAESMPCSCILMNEGPGELYYTLDDRPSAPPSVGGNAITGITLSAGSFIMWPFGPNYYLHYKNGNAAGRAWSQVQVARPLAPQPQGGGQMNVFLPTATNTPTVTPTITTTYTITLTYTSTRTITKTITKTVTLTMTPTRTITPTFTNTQTCTITPTITPTSTRTP